MPKSSKEDTKTFSNFNLNGVCAQLLSHFQLFVTLWTVPGQAPLSLGLSQQKYWSGLPFPPPEDFTEPRIDLASLMSPALSGGFFTTRATILELND